MSGEEAALSSDWLQGKALPGHVGGVGRMHVPQQCLDPVPANPGGHGGQRDGGLGGLWNSDTELSFLQQIKRSGRGFLTWIWKP